ncbi:hypothetical protein [Streptomyces sp900116325]|uniref:Uncharacterized protein n=1 Tax=Streptomyces sp. 900116325 TaxID=3154295 RepID=A0ABV2UHD6_9ACTN
MQFNTELMNGRQGWHLDQWIDRIRADDLPALHGFANGLGILQCARFMHDIGLQRWAELVAGCAIGSVSVWVLNGIHGRNRV